MGHHAGVRELLNVGWENPPTHTHTHTHTQPKVSKSLAVCTLRMEQGIPQMSFKFWGNYYIQFQESEGRITLPSNN